MIVEGLSKTLSPLLLMQRGGQTVADSACTRVGTERLPGACRSGAPKCRGIELDKIFPLVLLVGNLNFQVGREKLVGPRRFPLEADTGSMPISNAEREYIVGGVVDDLRNDGRGRLDYRQITIDLGVVPQSSGSARVRLGIIPRETTDVIVAVKADIGPLPRITPRTDGYSARWSSAPSRTWTTWAAAAKPSAWSSPGRWSAR